MKRPSAILGSFLLAALVGALPSPGAAAVSGLEIVPFFKTADVRERPVNLAEILAGKRVVVVLFWDWRRATSTRELNVLGRLYGQYANEGLEVLAVEGEGVRREEVVERLDKLRLIGTVPPFTVVPDPGGRLARQFRVEDTPRTFLVNRAGRVVWRLEGFRAEDEAALEEALKDALGIAPPPSPRPALAAPADSPAGRAPAAVAPWAPPVPPEDPKKGLLEKFRYFGNYHLNRKEPAKAEEYYRKYLALASEDVTILLKLGEALAAQEAYDKAREIWEAVIRIDPGNAEADDNIRRLIRGEY
jgi:tetratricopeptide (TPR) repeat protein